MAARSTPRNTSVSSVPSRTTPPVTPLNKTGSTTHSSTTPAAANADSSDLVTAEGDADSDDKADGHAPSVGVSTLTAQNLAASNQWTASGSGTAGMFDLEDATFSSDDDSDSDAEPDFELNDDDDYDAVDNISETSDRSDAFEADVEREILAAGENNIDWDDENTYAYNDSWDAHQYSMGLLEFGEPATAIERELFSRNRRQSSVRPGHDTSHLNNFLKGTPLDEDWSSSSSSGSEAGGEQVKDETGSVKAADEQSDSSTTDDETDDDALLSETVHTPSVTLNRPTSRLVQRTPSVRSSVEGQASTGRTPGKFGIMRKFKINPNKAVAFSTADTSARGGRTIHFNAPRHSNLRWISAHTSRSSSSSSNRAPMLDFGDSRTGSIITDVINGRLFQQFNCNPQEMNARSRSQAEFARTAMLRNAFPRFAGGVFGDFDESAIDDETHEQAMSLVDFHEDEDDEEDDDVGTAASMPRGAKTPMLPPARPFGADDTVRATTAFGNKIKDAQATAGAQEMLLPSSPLAHVSRAGANGMPELGAAFEPRLQQPGTPDSDEFPSSRPTTSGQSSSPHKRRNTGEFDEPSSLTPVMKRQRV